MNATESIAYNLNIAKYYLNIASGGECQTSNSQKGLEPSPELPFYSVYPSLCSASFGLATKLVTNICWLELARQTVICDSLPLRLHKSTEVMSQQKCVIANIFYCKCKLSLILKMHDEIECTI